MVKSGSRAEFVNGECSQLRPARTESREIRACFRVAVSTGSATPTQLIGTLGLAYPKSRTVGFTGRRGGGAIRAIENRPLNRIGGIEEVTPRCQTHLYLGTRMVKMRVSRRDSSKQGTVSMTAIYRNQGRCEE